MRKRFFTLILLIMAMTVITNANIYQNDYDFMVDGICYNKNSDGTSVAVTYRTVDHFIERDYENGDYDEMGDFAYEESVPAPGGDYYYYYYHYYRYYGNQELSGVLNIPSTVTYGGKTYSVTSIDDYAFSRCNSLTSVTIPNSVISIGKSAFSRCTGLTSVTIPNSVTSIGNSAFYYCSGLTSVTIGNSVTTIGLRAFYNCTGLTLVNIPNSVTSIGGEAFRACSDLTSMVVESGNTKYDSRNNCNAIIETATNNLIFGCKNTIIPNSVTSIGEYAFSGCSGLTSIEIPNTVTSIGSYAFSGCSGLIDIKSEIEDPSIVTMGYNVFPGVNKDDCTLSVPNGTSSIYKQTKQWNDFSNIVEGKLSVNGLIYGKNEDGISVSVIGCSVLGNIVIPNTITIDGNNYSVTSIGSSAFKNCSGLTSVTIPNSVTSIGNYAFSGCSGLTSLTIPNSVTSIGNYAFSRCSGLTSVTIPNSVTSIGRRAFSGCSGLTSVTWNSKNCSNFSSSNYDYGPFNGLTGITSFVFGNEVEHIPAYLCYGLTGLTSVTIPNSVTSIDYSAFYYCSSLTSVTISNSVTSIGGSAFYGCSGLTSVTIPNSVTSIGEYAFSGCSGLTSVTIPNSVTSIGGKAFENCRLETVNWNAVNCDNFDFWEEDYYGDIYGEWPPFYRCSINTFNFGNTVERIPAYICYGCSGLTSVTIGNSVTSIGGRAFSGCSGLNTVTWNAKNCSDFSSSPFNGLGITSFIFGCEVEHIPSCLCYNLTNLSSLTIPNSVTSIGRNALSGTSWYNNQSDGLVYAGMVAYKYKGTMPDGTSIALIDGCKGVADEAFYECSGLTSVTIPNSVKTIGCSTFSGCSGLTSVTIPNSVTEIGSSAFYGCYGVSGELVVPNNVTTIGGQAFNGCSMLTSLVIGKNITSIGTSAFNGCTNLRSIYSKILAPENVSYGTSIFNGVSINYCKLYVPVGTLDSYQFTAPWNDFLNIIEYDYGPEFIMGDANGDGTIDVADYVDVASYILEQDPQPFNFAAADLDEDNTIDVADLVGVAYLALNYEGAPMLAAAVDSPETASISMDATVNSIASVQYEVSINLSNNVALTALQMDINLPQGMTLVDASLTDRVSASHQVAFNQLTNGDYRLLASSSALKCFKNNDGAVLTLTLAGNPDGNGCLSGIKLAAPSSTRYSVGDIELNFNPTGVDNVTTAARFYSDGSNIIIDSPTDGTAQIVLPNGMNKTVKVATGRNVFETPIKGLIIVKMGNKVEKLQF